MSMMSFSLHPTQAKALSLFIFLCLPAWLWSQDEFPFPSLSPKGTISQQVGNTLIDISYERPSARDRKIFGELVPWGKVWRTGAGKSTRISFSKEVKVGDQAVPPGFYSLYTVPNKDHWMVILNTDTSLYGAYGYEEEKDVARFWVKPTKSPRHYETLTIDIDIIPNNALIYLSWTDVQVSFKVETSTDREVEEFIEKELLSGTNRTTGNYTLAADHLLYHNKDLMNALELTKKALELDPINVYAARIQVDLYEKLDYPQKALEAIKNSIEITKKQSYEEKYKLRDIQALEERYKKIEASIKN